MNANQTVTVAAATIEIISDENEERMVSAYKLLHGLLVDVGYKLPTWDKVDLDTFGKIGKLAPSALASKAQARRKARLDAWRSAIGGVVATYMAKAQKAYIAYLENTSEEDRQFSTFAKYVRVPLTEIVKVLPDGTDAHKVMKELDYEVGQKKGDTSAPWIVAIPFVAPSTTETANDQAAQ